VSQHQKPVQEELRCLGYFGFGGGYEITSLRLSPKEASRGVRGDGSLYCNAACPDADACWKIHRKRCADLFPDIDVEYRRMQEAGLKGPDLVSAFQSKFDCAPPDVLVMGGNIEDGMCLGAGGALKDRGPGTLSYPLPPLQLRWIES